MKKKNLVNDPLLVAKRHHQLVQASITLFSRQGFYSTTVKEIADEAGVSAGLVYQYVQDKQDLLFLALLHIVQQNKDEIPKVLQATQEPLIKLQASVEAYTRVIAENKQAVLLTYRETKSLKPKQIEQMKQLELETNGLIEQCVHESIATGYLRQTNVELLVYRIITAAHVWALKYWRLAAITTLETYLEESIHVCWKSLLSAKGRRRYAKLEREGYFVAAFDANHETDPMSTLRSPFPLSPAIPKN
jgi:AcrR family transcriptional regulator